MVGGDFNTGVNLGPRNDVTMMLRATEGVRKICSNDVTFCRTHGDDRRESKLDYIFAVGEIEE